MSGLRPTMRNCLPRRRQAGRTRRYQRTKNGMLRKRRERAERKEAADELLDLEPGFAKRFGTRKMGQRKVVVVEVPVVAGGVFDVRLERDEHALPAEGRNRICASTSSISSLLFRCSKKLLTKHTSTSASARLPRLLASSRWNSTSGGSADAASGFKSNAILRAARMFEMNSPKPQASSSTVSVSRT